MTTSDKWIAGLILVELFIVAFIHMSSVQNHPDHPEILFVFTLKGETVAATKAENLTKALENFKLGLNPNIKYDKVFTTTDTNSMEWIDYSKNMVPVVGNKLGD